MSEGRRTLLGRHWSLRSGEEPVHTYWALHGRCRCVLVAVTFPVVHAGLVNQRLDPVQPEHDRPGSSVCHSGGGSRECVGG